MFRWKIRSLVLGAACAFLFSGTALRAQQTFSDWRKPFQDLEFTPILQLQLWASFSHGQEVYNDSTDQYQPVDDRLNLMFRRARIGFQVKPYKRLTFRFISTFDFIGRDVNAAHTGGVNTSARPNVDVWDARLQWKILANKENLYLNAGWFRPTFSRESLTSPFLVNSMEKAWSMNYVRRQIVGLGPGAAPGFTLGGLEYREDRSVNFVYHAGIFVPQYLDNIGHTNGIEFSPVYVGRVVVSLGDAESTSYKLGHQVNYFNERKGFSLGLSGFWEGKTDLFQANYGTQVDFLLNWWHINLDGDFNFFWREGFSGSNGNEDPGFTTSFQTGHVRAGINLILGKVFLEPTAMFVYLNGPMDLLGQQRALSVLSRYGQHRIYEFGINWYINRQHLKLKLHYTINRGDPGETGNGAIGNSYLFQSRVGPIRRGDWLGLGFNMVL